MSVQEPPEVSNELLNELLQLLQTHLPEREQPEDAPREQLRRLLEPIVDAPEIREPPLTPLQADFFGMKQNALNELADELAFNEERRRAFTSGNKVDKARMLARTYLDDEDARQVVDTYRFASACTTTLFSTEGAEQPWDREAMENALSEAAGFDVFAGSLADAEVSRVPKPVHAQHVADGRIAVRYAITRESSIRLDAGFRPTRFVEQDTVLVLFDPEEGTMELRGNAAGTARVADQARHDLDRHGVHAQFNQMTIDEAEVLALIDRIGGRVLRETARPIDPINGGIGSTSARLEPQSEFNDLREAPAYDDLPARDLNFWQVHFDHDGMTYSLNVNLAAGTLRFPKGRTTEPVIRWVYENLHDIKADR